MKQLSKSLQKKVVKLNSIQNIECLLFYGSITKNTKKDLIKDTDIIVVVKDISVNIDDLMELLFITFFNPDIHIYSIDEIKNDISHYTREYVLEYLAMGVNIYGPNIFKEKFKQIDKNKYKESIFIRTVEHIQMVRRVYFSKKYDEKYKLLYLKKYLARISKNILLFKNLFKYSYLDKLTLEETIQKLEENKLILNNVSKEINIPTLTNIYSIFCEVTTLIMNCRKELKMS